MAESTHHSALPAEHPERHEPTDINPRPLIWTTAVLLIVGVVILIGLFLLFRDYERSEASRDPLRQRSALEQGSSRPSPQIPYLQGIPGYHENTPDRDTHAWRDAELRILQSYGHGAEEGFARIPITRAMELLSKRNGPATQPGSTHAPQ